MRLWDIEDVIGTLVLAAIFLVTIVAILARYVFNDSLFWSEEFARLGLVTITFVGIGAGIRRNSHVRLDTSTWAGPRLMTALAAVSGFVTLVFLVMLAYNGLTLSRMLRTAHTAALQLPLAWVYLAVGAAALLGALRLVQSAFARLGKAG